MESELAKMSVSDLCVGFASARQASLNASHWTATPVQAASLAKYHDSQCDGILTELTRRIDEANARANRAVKMLRSIQFCRRDYIASERKEVNVCPMCSGIEAHSSDCRLAAAIKETEDANR